MILEYKSWVFITITIDCWVEFVKRKIEVELILDILPDLKIIKRDLKQDQRLLYPSPETVRRISELYVPDGSDHD